MNINSIKSIISRNPLIYWLLKPAIAVRALALKKIQDRKLKVINTIIPLLASDPIVKLDEFQGVFSIGAQSDLFSRIAIYGYYEPELVKCCLTYLDKDRDIIDIGANIGFYTVLFAKQVNSAKVLAVEPTKNALNRLRQNIERNNVEDKVILYEGVVSDYNGFLNIKSIVGKEEYSTIGNPVHDSIAGQKIVEEKVACITLDDLVTTYSLNPGFIKMDVEGAEMLVFKNAIETLKKYRPIILSELSDKLLLKNGTSASEIIDILISANYKVVDPTNPSQAFENKKSGYGDILCIPVEYYR
ncbi:MAG TPA: FkbM family methyltransferase [Mucilaginibacter sp.]|jgi:FkbM family methyltransferase